MSSRLSIARMPQLHVLRIISRNDVLASLSMTHDRFVMWEEAVEEPVKDTSRDERVHVADGEAGRCQSKIEFQEC